MSTSFRAISAVAVLAAVHLAGCGTAARQSGMPTDAPLTPAAQARADGGMPAYAAADVAFMQGMIAHHAQALVMAGLAQTHAGSASVRTLAERIDVSQRDEIAFMERWLRERGETVPSVEHAHHAAPGHSASMPGMLTPTQLAQIEAARGVEFDRLFLTFMIQHHEGALVMLRQLFSSPGAGQEVNVSIFAAEVEADQTAEIDRMRAMLRAQAAGGKAP